VEGSINVPAILTWAEARGWPEVVIDDWNLIGGNETKWRLFAKYVSTPQDHPKAETDRLRYGRLAELAVAADRLRQTTDETL